jgi:uncharacterized protein (DUF2252 family)
VPLAEHAAFTPPTGRDPVALLRSQDSGRVADLVPIRHQRMAVSPFTFYRGAALPMAADLATTATTDLRTQVCGDAHLCNFGAYASAERRLVFDLNDFDETLPGPFEWDVKRLAASMVVAGRDNGFSAKQTRRVVLDTVGGYRAAMAGFATTSLLDVWYTRLDVQDAIDGIRAELPRKRIAYAESQIAKARTRDTTQALDKLTTVVGGRRRIASDPPLVVPVEELADIDVGAYYGFLRRLLTSYAKTLPAERRHLAEQVRITGVARKVVGVGSVGTRCWILLCEPYDDMGAILLQAKQAGPSVLAEYAGASRYAHQGERVVAGQRLMQATSDIFLGWQRLAEPDGPDAGAQDYYIRQLRDWKYSFEVERFNRKAMSAYGRLCGWSLARAHARSGDRIALAAYLGEDDTFDRALAEFAESYADVNAADHTAFVAAISDSASPVR